MDLKHKHWVLVAIGVLVAAFVVLAAWYILRGEQALAPAGETASTTPEDQNQAKDVPQHLTENAAYYDIDLTYPSVTPLVSLSPSANAAAVAEMKQFTEERAAEFKKNGNFANLTAEDVKIMRLDERKEALTSEYKMYSGAHTVSYVFQIYEDTLGAHPNGYYRTFTYDLRTGKSLTLSDLFNPSIPYLERMSARARADLPAIIKQLSGGYEGDSSMLADGTSPKEGNFQWFYIDGGNLVLIFPPYAVGPYALGTVTDAIPLAQLSDSLKVEYQ